MNTQRPKIDKGLDVSTFRSFYYLKEELVDFCKQEGLQASGGKIELTDRIAHYLGTGERLSRQVHQKTKPAVDIITEEFLIEDSFVCSEKHRAFFEQKIGKRFSFNVAFQKWLKENSGKTYSQAIDAYHRILDTRKKEKTVIDKQFEYNTYIRDFFKDNKGKTLREAIKCWNFKKSIQGHNKYEPSDLRALG